MVVLLLSSSLLLLLLLLLFRRKAPTNPPNAPTNPPQAEEDDKEEEDEDDDPADLGEPNPTTPLLLLLPDRLAGLTPPAPLDDEDATMPNDGDDDALAPPLALASVPLPPAAASAAIAASITALTSGVLGSHAACQTVEE